MKAQIFTVKTKDSGLNPQRHAPVITKVTKTSLNQSMKKVDQKRGLRKKSKLKSTIKSFTVTKALLRLYNI